MGYVVTIPLAVAKTSSGDIYLYEGATVPGNVSEDEINRLVDDGYVVKVADLSDPVSDDDDDEDEPKSLSEMSVDELTAYASDNGIDLGKATTEDGIRSKIIEAEQA